MTIKVTKDELRKMSIYEIKGFDISSKEEEDMIQEILNEKFSKAPPVVKFDYSKVPDITNAEQEAEWQKKIDDFYKKNSPLHSETVKKEAELEAINIEIAKVAAPETNTVSIVEVPKEPKEVKVTKPRTKK